MKKIFVIATVVLFSNTLYSQGFIWNAKVEAHHKTYDRVGLSRSAASPTSVSLEKYLPHIMNQGKSGMCLAYSLATCRTILYARNNNLTDANKISAEAYSPYYIYAKYKYTMGQDWEGGMSTYTENINRFGYAKMKDIEFPYYYPFTKNNLWNFSLPSYINLDMETVKEDKFNNIYSIYASEDAKDPNQEKIMQMKTELAKKRPILYGMSPLPESWNYMFGEDYWSDTIRIYCISDRECKNLTDDPSGFCTEHKPEEWEGDGHAMVVIGYDDDEHGGSFQIVNSWGSDFGHDGKIWVNYDVFVKTASGIQSFEKEKKSIFSSDKKSVKKRKKEKIIFPENEIGLELRDFTKAIEFNWIMFTQMNIQGGKYSGKQKDGKKEGKGTYILPNGVTYEGEWKNDKMHGIGKLTYNNLYEYHGEFKDGYFHGNGVLTKFDSWGHIVDKSDGLFSNGNFAEGKKMVDVNDGYWRGFRYEGGFRNNSFNDYGTLSYYAEELKWEGQFKDNHLISGTETTNLYEYTGEFLDTYPHGKGVKRFFNGEVVEGVWEYGELVEK